MFVVAIKVCFYFFPVYFHLFSSTMVIKMASEFSKAWVCFHLLHMTKDNRQLRKHEIIVWF